MSEQTQTIHDVVQERYGAIARGENPSCCGPSSDCSCVTPTLYDVNMITDLPVEVTSLSLG